MENTLIWEEVKTFYKTRFGIEAWVVEMLANLDILVLCASGASNKTISTFLEIDIDEVNCVILDTIHFKGWLFDLPLNPYKMFNDLAGTSEESRYFRFCAEADSILTHYPAYSDVNSEKLYNICSIVADIERRINDEWI